MVEHYRAGRVDEARRLAQALAPLAALLFAEPNPAPVKALLAQFDVTAFRPVLSSIRRAGSGAGSLREPIALWAREHGLPV